MDITEREERIIRTLSDMIKIPTVSHKEITDNAAEMIKYLQSRFPRLCDCGEWMDFSGGIMIRVKGSDGSLQPLCLMSHFDVAPVDGEWDREPFSGEVKDGKIYGRGAADTKGSLCAIFEAAEEFLASGEVLTRDLYILSSSKEEVGGRDAEDMANYFRLNSIVPELLVDEGGAIMQEVMAGVGGEYALMAMSERSFAEYFVIGNDNQVKAFGKKIVNKKLAKSVFPPECKEMFRRLTPNMSGLLKFLFKHIDFFTPILIRVMPKVSKQAAAMVLPECEFIKDGNLNQDGEGNQIKARLILRGTYHHNLPRMAAIAEKLAAKCNVKMEKNTFRVAPLPQDYTSNGVKIVENAVKAVLPQVIPSPFIIFGGTDARHFVDLAKTVVRFAPLRMNYDIVNRVHKPNEYIFTDSVIKAVDVYKAIIHLMNNPIEF